MLHGLTLILPYTKSCCSLLIAQIYAAILGIDTTSGDYTILSSKIPLMAGELLHYLTVIHCVTGGVNAFLGTSGIINGTECFAVVAKNPWAFYQYFKLSDGAMIFSSPDTKTVLEYHYDCTYLTYIKLT